MFYPSDELSAQLLESIPRKVAMWLFNLSVDLGPERVFEFGKLRVNLLRGQLSYGLGGDEVVIEWDTDGDHPTFTNPRTNTRYMSQGAKHINNFVFVEQAIYEEMQIFQKQVEEQRDRDNNARDESV